MHSTRTIDGAVPANGGFELNAGMLIEPEATPESAWTGHVPFAGWLVSALQPRVFVELGTHRGASYLAMCQAISAAHLNARAYAVDTWTGDVHAGAYTDEVFARLSDYHNARYGAFSKLMRMTFDDAAGYFDENSIDLLHIDGLHTYEAVRHDFEVWSGKVSSRGVVLFHDICVRERDFGVWKFWEECKQRYPHFEFTHSHGLGVLMVGEHVAPVLKTLAALELEDAAIISGVFARLGAAAEDRLERRRLVDALNHEYAARHECSGTVLAPTLAEMREVLRQDLAHVRNTASGVESNMGQALGVLEGRIRCAFDEVLARARGELASGFAEQASRTDHGLRQADEKAVLHEGRLADIADRVDTGKSATEVVKVAVERNAMDIREALALLASMREHQERQESRRISNRLRRWFAHSWRLGQDRS